MPRVHLHTRALFTAIAVWPGLVGGFSASLTKAGEQPQQAVPKPVDYASQVKPILTRHCVSCHGAAKPRGGLRLDTAAAAMAGGKSGPVVLPGHGEESPLIAAVRGEGAANACRSIGRRWDGRDQAARRLDRPGGQGDRRRAAGRAARPVALGVRPAQTAGRAQRSRSPAGRETRSTASSWPGSSGPGCSPSPEADRATLLRRVSLDLIGLPPSPEEIDAFLADRSPDALRTRRRPAAGLAPLRRAVGAPLARPGSLCRFQRLQHRRPALDLEVPRLGHRRLQRRHAVRPVRDRPDRRRPPAGDASLAQRIATGFHRNTQINQEGGIDVEQFRVESIIDRVNTTGTVFLGLTIGCAQCHDHKYDPISQREYYRLFAFFNNVDEPELEIATPAELARRQAIRAPDRRVSPRAGRAVSRPRRARAEVGEDARRSHSRRRRRPTSGVAFDLPREKRSPSQRRALVELMIARRPGLPGRARGAHEAAGRRAQVRHDDGRAASDRASPRPTHIHLGGDFTRKGERVEPGVPARLASPGGSEPGNAAGSHGPGALAGRSPQSADGPRRRQPDLASLFRPRPGRDRQRLRHAGLAPQSSRAARLAGLRAHGPGLEPEGDPSADRRLGDLPPGVAGAPGGPGGRSRQSAAVAAGAAPPRRRADPRRRPDRAAVS